MNTLYINGILKTPEDLLPVRHFQYRGVLDFCNYSCHYCPFSKRPVFHRKMAEDKECLSRLLERLKMEKEAFTFQIVPYGEALIHTYYWEFLAKLSQIKHVPAVGCQTNASFSVEKMLEIFQKHGGIPEKLRLWCTFHPSMTSTEIFLEQIKKLRNAGITLCAGAVANPAETDAISHLFSLLPRDIYFWLNRMDGQDRPYTPEERAFFERIDPFFLLEENSISIKNAFCPKETSCLLSADLTGRRSHENSHFVRKAAPKETSRLLSADLTGRRSHENSHFVRRAAPSAGKNIFLRANGDFFACNISPKKLGNIYLETSGSAEPNLTERRGYESSHSVRSAAPLETSGSAEPNLTERRGYESSHSVRSAAPDDKNTENISAQKFQKKIPEETTVSLPCRKKCSCFLAYKNHMDIFPELCLFLPYPSFRIVKKYQAAFFDVDHTLIPSGETTIPEKTVQVLKTMSRYCDIYLATSLPYAAAMKKCRNIHSLLSGGIFSGGADILCGIQKPVLSSLPASSSVVTDNAPLPDQKKHHYLWIEDMAAENLCRHYEKKNFFVRAYKNTSHPAGIYKITLIPKHKKHLLSEQDITLTDKSVRFFLEDNHIQIVHAAAGKQAAVSFICSQMGYQREQILTCGDSAEDREMAFF